ncbi:hypothetical protein ACU686_15825 [Yinghuangia aomiensis]
MTETIRTSEKFALQMLACILLGCWAELPRGRRPSRLASTQRRRRLARSPVTGTGDPGPTVVLGYGRWSAEHFEEVRR